jgi:hypothetical protein
MYYDIQEEKEIDYISDYLFMLKGKKLNKTKLGIH